MAAKGKINVNCLTPSCLAHVFPKPSLGSRLLQGESNVTIWIHRHVCATVLCVLCKLQTLAAICDMSKGSLYVSNKPPLVGEHAFPLLEFVGYRYGSRYI